MFLDNFLFFFGLCFSSCPPSGISFIPREVGEHLVSIKKNGRHVANSPISIMVVQSEIGDASRVKVFGPGLVEGRTFQMADFIVDTRDAGEMLVILSSWYDCGDCDWREERSVCFQRVLRASRRFSTSAKRAVGQMFKLIDRS